MIESYLESSDTIDITPSQVVEAICVLVIDDSRVTERLISADPNIDRTDITVLYRGIVDVTGMPILGVDDVIDSPVTVDEVTALPSGLSE
ncbi:hypothetical protein ATC00_28370 [Sinorhizobium americanum]|nr:hypothetical protein ATC00_28370 [Sinorhizobium americanum]